MPFAPDFRPFAEAGQALAELHVNYEQAEEFELEKHWRGEGLDLRVDKMKYKKDEGRIVYNDLLTLEGVPPEVEDYRLGTRSALAWVVDQYQVTTDKRSGIANDPNRAEDQDYILRLLGQVITVSLATRQIVAGLPEFREE